MLYRKMEGKRFVCANVPSFELSGESGNAVSIGNDAEALGGNGAGLLGAGGNGGWRKKK